MLLLLHQHQLLQQHQLLRQQPLLLQQYLLRPGSFQVQLLLPIQIQELRRRKISSGLTTSAPSLAWSHRHRKLMWPLRGRVFQH